MPHTKQKDQAVFGVLSDVETDPTERRYSSGNFVSVYRKTDNIDRVNVNSVGEGAIWVCDEGGNLGIGNYVCSSSTAGYGMKQNPNKFKTIQWRK